MIKKLKPAGTVLFGRAMMAQLGSEMTHLNVKNPVIVNQSGFKKQAVKAASLFPGGLFDTIPVVERNVPADCDFLILAGGRVLADHFNGDPRHKALVPLHHDHLREITGPVSDFLVIDRSFIKKQSVVRTFMANYALSVTDGIAGFPMDLSIPKSFTYSCRTSVYSGHSSLNELPGLIRSLGVVKPLILTDKGIVAVGLLPFVLDELGDLTYELFDDIPADSNMHVVNRISRIYNEKSCDGIIAFGGGSVLDTGKGVYLNVSLGQSDLFEMVGSNHIPRLNTPFITIPTTSGTGSEVTKVAVISDVDRSRKLLFNSSNLQPDYALLDSRLTTSLPPHLTSITAMDALTHAVEAFTCIGKNPLSDSMAWAAIELIRDHMIPAITDSENLTHRRSLALASNLAGQAFSNSMVGMVHSIGHSIGSVCHVPHGSCMSVLLPHGLEYNYNKIEPMLSQLLWALAGEKIYRETPGKERAEKSIGVIRGFNEILREKTAGRHPEKFSDILNREGENLVEREHFESIARTALGDASIVYNPEELRFADIVRVLEASY